MVSNSVKATDCDLDGSVFSLIHDCISKQSLLNSIHLAVCSPVAGLYYNVLVTTGSDVL